MANTNKKQRSQAPVALVYFITLLLALSLVGGVSYYMLNKYKVFSPEKSDSENEAPKSMNLLFARVSDKGEFKDLCVMRVDSVKREIILVPQTDVTKTRDGSKTYKQVLAEGGMKKLQRAVADNLGVDIQHYMTVTNSAFEQVADFMGGMSYTAPQELYYISQESNKDDISVPKGDLVTLSGRQIINLASIDTIYNTKKQGNLEFLSAALEQIINNGFRQSDVTKDNLFNLYEILSKNSDTDINKEVFNEVRKFLNVMLEEKDIPAKSLKPTGMWNSDFTAFTMNNEYLSTVASSFGVAFDPNRGSAAVTQPTEPPPVTEPDTTQKAPETTAKTTTKQQ